MTCNPNTWEEAKDRLKDILQSKSEASLDSSNSVSKTLKKKKSLQAEKQAMFSASMYIFIITKLKNLKCDGTQL